MSTNESVARVVTTDRRKVNIALWVLQAVLAVFFIVVEAIPKLYGAENFVRIFDMVGLGQWLRYFVGAAELAGGLGLVIPRLSGLSALGLSAITFGAVITQIFVIGATAFALIPGFVTVLLLIVAWGRRFETRSTIGLLVRRTG